MDIIPDFDTFMLSLFNPNYAIGIRDAITICDVKGNARIVLNRNGDGNLGLKKGEKR